MKTTNVNDIFFRNLTISLLELLNTNITINQARDNVMETFNVPFMYNYGSDEGFLRDFYIGLPDGCQIPTTEGTYDMVPRGIVTLQTFQVKSSDITNRFIRGSYTEVEKDLNDENILTGYSAQLYSLPMAIAFDIKVITASINQAFKIAQNLLDILYSHRVIYFQYKNIRIPAQLFFPDTKTIDKKNSFTYQDNNKLILNMNTEVETYFPSFESTSKRKSSNIMERILHRSFDKSKEQIHTNWIDQNTQI